MNRKNRKYFPLLKDKALKALFICLMVCLVNFAGIINKAFSYEYTGFTFELMNGNKTNFWGFGIFTSDRRFTAGISLLVSQQMFSGDSTASEKSPDTYLWNRDYPFYSLDFYGNYNFIRTPRSAYFVGMGIQPLIPSKYVYSYSFGIELFQSEATRFYFAFKNVYTNYVTNSDGMSSHLNRIAQGPQFLFGFKYAFLGKKRVKATTIQYPKKEKKAM